MALTTWLVVGCAILLQRQRRRRKRKDLAKIPLAPGSLPLLGNIAIAQVLTFTPMYPQTSFALRAVHRNTHCVAPRAQTGHALSLFPQRSSPSCDVRFEFVTRTMSISLSVGHRAMHQDKGTPCHTDISKHQIILGYIVPRVQINRQASIQTMRDECTMLSPCNTVSLSWHLPCHSTIRFYAHPAPLPPPVLVISHASLCIK